MDCATCQDDLITRLHHPPRFKSPLSEQMSGIHIFSSLLFCRASLQMPIISCVGWVPPGHCILKSDLRAPCLFFFVSGPLQIFYRPELHQLSNTTALFISLSVRKGSELRVCKAEQSVQCRLKSCEPPCALQTSSTCFLAEMEQCSIVSRHPYQMNSAQLSWQTLLQRGGGGGGSYLFSITVTPGSVMVPLRHSIIWSGGTFPPSLTLLFLFTPSFKKQTTPYLCKCISARS